MIRVLYNGWRGLLMVRRNCRRDLTGPGLILRLFRGLLETHVDRQKDQTEKKAVDRDPEHFFPPKL
jgi:hypothetical protein